ncbi:hypothetical protein Y1Q_0022464 [Alligator mississippiensis]|uniref:Uncharacterized protein n=1 Tax=Alligator mississippiensis TaxID=8496 RepID=A0A151N0B8_ALLMI|nr:hypothetical protein Y1Q_0022464 [Alligator mississippiensis]
MILESCSLHLKLESAINVPPPYQSQAQSESEEVQRRSPTAGWFTEPELTQDMTGYHVLFGLLHCSKKRWICKRINFLTNATSIAKMF